MIILLSPTKTQSSGVARKDKLKSNPATLEKAGYLISLLQNLTVPELSKLMKIKPRYSGN